MTDKLRFDSPSRLRGFSWIHRDVEKCYSELLTARAKILAMSSVNDHTDRQFYIRGRQSEANRLAQHAREIINFFNETPYFEKPKDAANHAHIDLDPAIESPADITSGDVDAAIDTAIVTMRTEYVRLLRLQQKCAVETPKPRVPLWVRRAAIIVVAIAALALVVMGVIQLVPSFFYNQGVNAVADARLLSNQARQEVAEQSRQAEQAEATKAATESVATVEAAEAATESVSVAVDPWIEAYQRWEQAIAAFTIVHSFTPYTALFGPYQDARMQLADTYEEVFRIRVENRDWDAAIELAARFMDAKVDEQRARQAVRDSYYLPANELFQHKDYPGVRALLDRMPLAGEGLDFEAETLYQDSYYQQAEDASQQTPPDWMQVEDLLTALLERPGGNQRMNAVALLSTSYITRAQGAIDSAHWDDARAVLELMRVAPFSTLPSPRYEEALDLYRSTYYQPGSVLLQSGDYESARSLFDGLLKLPEGIGAYFDTGALYCQTFYGAANTYFTSGQYDEARATLIDFRTDEAEFAAQCDILGLLRQAYFVPAAEAVRAGAWLEALGLLEPLYALKPDDGNTRALLIQTYFTLGQRAVDEGDLAAAQGYLETMRAKRFEVSGLETLLAQVYYNRAQQVLTASADVSRWEDARAFLIPLFNLNHSYRDTETLLRESYYVPFNDQIQRGLIGYNGDLCVQAREAMETDDMQALLADYKDTATLIHETYYCEVQVAIHDGDMDAARESLDRLSALSPNFRDIESLYNQTYYLPALAAMQAGEWQQARRLWSPLLARERFYADAFIQLRESYYLPAKQAFDQRQWDVVRRELIPLIYGTAAEPALDPNYKDAFDLLRESYYLPGAEAFESSSWDAARTALKPLIFAIDTPTPIDPDYKDAFDLLRESYYQPAMQAFNQRAWEVVRHQLEPLLFATNGLPAVDSEYHDSRTLWYVSYYNQAVDALQSQQWETARQLLTSLDQQNPNYPGVQTLLRETYYRPAKLALEAEQWE